MSDRKTIHEIFDLLRRIIDHIVIYDHDIRKLKEDNLTMIQALSNLDETITNQNNRLKKIEKLKTQANK